MLTRSLFAAATAAMLPLTVAPRAAAGAAAPKSDIVTEFVLYERGDGGDKRPIFSDADEGLIRMLAADEVRKAFAAGKARPVLGITRRRCTYPLDANGKRQALGSTCEETEL